MKHRIQNMLMMFLLLVFTFSGSVLAEEHQAYASQGNVAFFKENDKIGLQSTDGTVLHAAEFDGNQGVAPGVRIDDGLFPNALGPSRLDAVHGQRFDHGGADITGHAAQRAEGHDDQGQGQEIHPVGEELPARVAAARGLDAAGRENVQQRAEDPDE